MKKKEIVWGFAGPFYGDYNCWQGDQLVNQLNFAAEHGFKSVHMGFGELKEPVRRDQIADLIVKHDLQVTVGVHLSTMDPDRDKIKRQSDEFLESLRIYGDLLRVPAVNAGAGAGHRFMRDVSLNERLDRMTEAFTPLAKACHEMKRPLAIENHGDFYCSDLVELCRRVPHMNIWLDTGNCYLIGEKTIPACREAAPYTVGTHLKDHTVQPNPQDLKFELDGAALGSGDVGIGEIYHDLVTLAKAEKLILQWELIVPKGTNALACLEQSWDYIKRLEQ